jgi:tetratricopeptide (TPR) repeat protein
LKEAAEYNEAVKPLEAAVRLNPADPEARYQLGFVLVKLDQFEAAFQQLQEAKRLNPSASETRYQLAQALRRLHRPEQAREELQAFEQLKEQGRQKKIAAGLHAQGNEHMAANNVKAAIEAYQQALKLDSGNASLHYNLGFALAGTGQPERARLELLKAIQIDPNIAPAHYRLGLLYQGSGQIAMAEKAFKTAIAIDPQFVEAERNLAALSAKGK